MSDVSTAPDSPRKEPDGRGMSLYSKAPPSLAAHMKPSQTPVPVATIPVAPPRPAN